MPTNLNFTFAENSEYCPTQGYKTQPVAETSGLVDTSDDQWKPIDENTPRFFSLPQ